MVAVIDVGSNTIRMLLSGTRTEAPRYYRQITRLAGGWTEKDGLSEAAMNRSLTTLKFYKHIISSLNISRIQAVGTAALRRARNSQVFIDAVYATTGIKIEIIDGEKEAYLAGKGALSVIEPIPKEAVILDIGGGSTELSYIVSGHICFQKSYPLGVVRLCEECASREERFQKINATFSCFSESIHGAGFDSQKTQLIGTAGTITTLAAIHLGLREYDADKINNHEISACWINKLQSKLDLMTVAEREEMIGMEEGRGDLILPGLEILLYLLNQLQLPIFRVSDSGLLEGVMLDLTDS